MSIAWRLCRVCAFAVAVACLGCGGQKQPQVDPVSEAMKQQVAGSAARIKVIGRPDWEVPSSQGSYWIKVKLHNMGGDGPVALRGAVKTLVPYVGIGAGATEPMYFQMRADQSITQQLRGQLSGRTDRASGCVVEVYPKWQDTSGG